MSRNPNDLNLPPRADEDIGAQYQQHRQQLAEQVAADEMTAAASSAAPAPGAAAAADAASAAPTAGRLARTMSDVGRGVIETPRAIVKGARDAFSNLFNMGDELAGWVSEKAPYLSGGFQISERGLELLTPEQVKRRGIRSGVQTWSGPTPADESQPPDAKNTRTGDLIPDINAPKTVTGGLVKGVAQFITGMAGAGRVLGGAGYLASTAKGAASSFTAFDPHAERLSNLIEKFPVLSNPVTRYLQSSPDDNAAEGRFKNAIEGVGLGLLTDGFVRGVKMLRQSLIARNAAQSAADATGSTADDVARAALERPRELADDAFSQLGSEADTAPLVKKLKGSSATLEDVQGAKAGAATEPQTMINFARIDAPDDVKKVMQRLADIGKPAADEARAGVQSFADVKLDAAHQDAWNILVSRRQGQPLNASESLAARQLWTATTDKVAQLAETAATSPSEANLFAFRKMLDVHDLVQREVLGARASTARALSSWRIPAGGGAERLRNVQAALDASGGSEVSRLLAERMSTLAKAGMVKEMTAVAEKGVGARTRDAVLEAWINGLLSNPVTHVANTTSNASVVALRMGERAVAEKISQALGTEGGVAAGEAGAQYAGLQGGIRDMFRYYSKALDVPAGGEMPQSPTEALNIPALGKIEHAPSISSDAFGLSSSGWLGRAVDLGGETIRTPGKALGASDEFFKTIGYRMELNAQAVRQAAGEVNAGQLAADGFKQRVAEIIAHPPQNLRLAAADAALYQTFTNAPGNFGKTLSKLTTMYPALKVIMPFTKTPSNILSFTFERTPLAPLMSKFRANVAAGGARRDLALAQMGLGTSAMLAFADATMNGQVSGRGPADIGQKQALQREGWQPYSLKIGDRWYSYNRLDPIGSLIGMSADATEMLMQAQHDSLDDPDTEKLAAATALAFAGNITNKTYLSGLSGAIEALNDPTRAAQSWTQRLAGSVVPAGVAQAERVQDPTVREVYSMMDAIRARTPGLSDKLPPRLDLWGQPVTTESGIGKPFDALSPVYSRTPGNNPIDQEILRLGANITMPPRRTSFDGVTVDLSQYPKAYSRYVELAGNALKSPAWGKGARDFLNDVVTDKSPLSAVYQLRSDGPDGGKETFIRDQINTYREQARRQLLEEFPKLKADVNEKKRKQRELKMPALNAAR